MPGLVLIAAEESSKVPFYILGGMLALWAVILAWLGLTRPNFPPGERATRGVMGLTLLLAVLAVVAAAATA